MYNFKINSMKALKITLLLALFVSVSSQTDKKSSDDGMSTYEKSKTQYDLLAHNKEKIIVPTEG